MRFFTMIWVGVCQKIATECCWDWENEALNIFAATWTFARSWCPAFLILIPHEDKVGVIIPINVLFRWGGECWSLVKIKLILFPQSTYCSVLSQSWAWANVKVADNIFKLWDWVPRYPIFPDFTAKKNEFTIVRSPRMMGWSNSNLDRLVDKTHELSQWCFSDMLTPIAKSTGVQIADFFQVLGPNFRSSGIAERKKQKHLGRWHQMTSKWGCLKIEYTKHTPRIWYVMIIFPYFPYWNGHQLG